MNSPNFVNTHLCGPINRLIGHTSFIIAHLCLPAIPPPLSYSIVPLLKICMVWKKNNKNKQKKPR